MVRDRVAVAVLPGIYFHQLGAGLGIGLALGVALGLIQADRRTGYKRPTDPLRFAIGSGIGLFGGLWLHCLGLGWGLGMGLGLVFGLFLGAAVGLGPDEFRK